MRTSTLAILAAVTVPVTALAIFLPAPTTTAPAAAKGEKLLPGLRVKLAQAAQLSVVSSDGTVVLQRKPGAKADQGWGLVAKGGYPVQASSIKPVLDGLVALQGTEPRTERTALYGRLDLAAPGPGSESHGVTLRDEKGGEVAAVILGRHKYDASGGGNDSIYARLPGATGTWLAKPAITLPAGALDWIDKSVLSLDADKIRSITITLPGAPPLVVSREKAADKLAVQGVPAGGKLKSDTAAADIAGGFDSIELEDVEPATKLSGTPAATAQAVTFDGLTVTLNLTKQGEHSWAIVAASGKGAAAIAARTGGWAYQIPDAKVSALESKMADLVEAPAKK